MLLVTDAWVEISELISKRFLFYVGGTGLIFHGHCLPYLKNARPELANRKKNTLPHSPGLVELGLFYSGVWNTWSEYCLLDVYGLTNLQKHLILVTMYSTSNDYGNKFRCMWRLLVSMMKILFIKPVSIRSYGKYHRVTMSRFSSDTYSGALIE